MKPKLISKTEARKRQLRPITHGYQLPREEWMMNNVIRDMERSGIAWAAVDETDGVEIWRS